MITTYIYNTFAYIINEEQHMNIITYNTCV